MWLSDRRKFLAGVAAVALLLSGCGFTPVYGPQGAGNRLLGQVSLQAPDTRDTHQFKRHFEERLGRVVAGRYVLRVDISTDEQDMGGTSSGNTTRYRVNGDVDYSLVEGKIVRLSGTTDSFTGYSNTGSTVATIAARRDAYARLMVILSDQVIDELLLSAPDLPDTDLPETDLPE